jgi:hypothetical protein
MDGREPEIITALRHVIVDGGHSYDIAGFINRKEEIYPLGTDTKVLSTVFELIVRPLVVAVAHEHGYTVAEPLVQNHYPDFTLVPLGASQNNPKGCIALDIKTTYRRPGNRFGYTLGGYTSFIRVETPSKNIVFPFDSYHSHWVIGFVYTRVAEKKAAEAKLFSVPEMDLIASPYKDVAVFVQEKWRISGDAAGSGNTTNIGSIYGTLEEFVEGKGVFESEAEFLAYWRGYGKTAAARTYSRVVQYRAIKKD